MGKHDAFSAMNFVAARSLAEIVGLLREEICAFFMYLSVFAGNANEKCCRR